MIPTRLFVVSVSMLLLCAENISAGEVLHSISDQSEALARPAAPAAKPERRISYRVICAPGDEALPDCDQPLDDAEVDDQPAAPGLPVPDFPPEAVAEDGDESNKAADAQVNHSKREIKSPAKQSSKSSKTSKASKTSKSVEPSSKKAKSSAKTLHANKASVKKPAPHKKSSKK